MRLGGQVGVVVHFLAFHLKEPGSVSNNPIAVALQGILLWGFPTQKQHEAEVQTVWSLKATYTFGFRNRFNPI